MAKVYRNLKPFAISWRLTRFSTWHFDERLLLAPGFAGRLNSYSIFFNEGLVDHVSNNYPLKNDALFLTDLQTTKNDPGSQYGSTGDPGSV